MVEDSIHAMSLGDYANKLIGGHCYMKGLPSGERRRVSIARELVMRPHILFIDEPLYHLDRFSFNLLSPIYIMKGPTGIFYLHPLRSLVEFQDCSAYYIVEF